MYEYEIDSSDICVSDIEESCTKEERAVLDNLLQKYKESKEKEYEEWLKENPPVCHVCKAKFGTYDQLREHKRKLGHLNMSDLMELYYEKKLLIAAETFNRLRLGGFGGKKGETIKWRRYSSPEPVGL